MDVRQIRYLIAIADAGSISEAADRLGMAQPALSAALVRIEKDAGSRLFIRTRSGVTPTATGALLLEQATSVMAQMEAFDRLAADVAGGNAGSLTVGFATSALYEILPVALAKLRALSPNIRIVLKEMSSDAQARALQEGQIDVGFCRSPLPPRRRMREKLLSRAPLVAAIPNDVETESDGSVRLSAIAGRGFILPPESQGLLQARILQAIQKAGIRPRVVQEASRSQTMLACVAAGLGVALVPRSIQATSFRGVRFCRIKPAVLPTQDISAIWQPSARPQIADRFVAMLSPRDFASA